MNRLRHSLYGNDVSLLITAVSVVYVDQPDPFR